MQVSDPVPAPLDAPSRGQAWWSAIRFPVLVFLGVAAVLVVVVGWSNAVLDRSPVYPVDPVQFPGSWLLEGWYRFDGGWYRQIIEHGYYSMGPDLQSPIAFFPAYPLVVRAVAVVLRDPILAGIVVTFASGLTTTVLLYRWGVDKFGTGTARLAVLVLVLYPYAYYLFGAVYADALFLAATLGAFVLLEKGHPILAGVAGAVATAARPVGIAVLVGLVAVTICKRGGLRRWRELRPADAGVLLSLAGIGAWCTYLWISYGDPLLFNKVQSAAGWDQGTGPATWFKRAFVGRLPKLPFWISDVFAGSTTHHPTPWAETVYTLGLVLQGALILGALLLVPLVIRRLGWGYGIYVLAVVAIPLLGSKDFQGVGRYVLAAFPCFVVGAELLGKHRTARLLWFPISAALLVLLASGYARGYYIA